MIVYLLLSKIDSDVYGVFETEEKAKSFAENYSKNNPASLPLDSSDFYIFEQEVQ